MENQKWTRTEEKALRAGVAKHGVGKWNEILHDPEFSSALSRRSNVSIKDKWRNLNIGTRQSAIARTPQVKIPPDCSAGAGCSTAATPHSDGSSQIIRADDDISPPRYNELIFEALESINDVNGSSIGAIISFFLEQKHVVPKKLGRRLKKLVRQGKIEKVGDRFKLSNETQMAAETPILKPEDAEVAEAIKEAECEENMAEVAEAMLQLATRKENPNVE